MIFEQKAGYLHETEHDQVIGKVNDQGNIVGFPILKDAKAFATTGLHRIKLP